MKSVQLGKNDLMVTPICLGTMTFGEQVDEATTQQILSHAVERGINFVDTAEMYPVPTKADTFTTTETYIGQWLKKNPSMRQKIILATKVTGPSRATPLVRTNHGMSTQDMKNSLEASLRRLQTDVIDLYQIHWPEHHVPAFGNMYYNPKNEISVTSIHDQLETLVGFVKAGKVRYIGLSNETPYGVHEFIRLAEQHGLPRIASVQNVYCLINRTVENALDESLHRLNISLLAYLPLGFGSLTGKYDKSGFTGVDAPKDGRIGRYESAQKQRWGRAESLTAARRYNQLARDHGLTPVQIALAFCYNQWRVASTIIGVTSMAQLDENIKIWGMYLSEDVLKAIDAIRWEIRDSAV
ncbi:MAG: aldo/keto reductase [Limnohabitans sp.]|nr:aldo/keto reductase [Limnohabitans sp.]